MRAAQGEPIAIAPTAMKYLKMSRSNPDAKWGKASLWLPPN